MAVAPAFELFLAECDPYLMGSPREVTDLGTAQAAWYPQGGPSGFHVARALSARSKFARRAYR